ncbi:MAG: hypothetical protein A3G49_01375 [Candidatus Sungbacteria bacterium RIFCSPLOWO2_12_FULL_41_11]|uniref:Uncharacterized protein n=1 Tax=Candidatus Sungbacteria bacterium RIFCSPLOWO2_12_FULL_41_11 TaxID=1802286 RepID=A0A1G2LP31_9BACT|nr:MAG: hypothetical protein A3G49_01375 [Candidatus Sungbacteria bacterium RIFCSPLOWO2_12_FULL_41_11]
MKILVKVVIFIGFFSCLAGFIRSGPVWAEELKFPIFSRENIKRVINGELQDILPLVDKNFLVVYFGGLDEAARTDLQRTLEVRFGLEKIDTLYEKPDFIRFRYLKTPLTIDAVLARWNEVSAKVPFASSVFEFPEGPFALSGVIRIQWKKFFPKEEIIKLMAAMNLEITDFNEGTNTTTARPTVKSGKNVFLWAIVFAPENEFRVLSSRVEFIRVKSPIRAEARVEAECLNGAGAGNIVATGVFCYRVKFFRAPDIKVSFDDLSINTKLLRTWLPQGLPQNLRRFEGDRTYKAAVEKLATGEVVDTVEYKFRILRSGEFILPLLRYYYNIAGNVEDNKNRLEGIIPEARILVSPLSPKSQITVNGIPNAVSVISSDKGEQGLSEFVPWWLGIIGVCAGAFLIILAFKSGKKPDEKVEASKEEKARVLWERYRGQVDVMNAVDRLKLLKRMLGLYYFGNEYGPLASANSADWKHRLEMILPLGLVLKSLEFVNDVENARQSNIDFRNLIREIFSWEK